MICVILEFRIIKTLSIPNHKSWGADILREYSPPNMCHMSHVTFFVDKVVELVGGGPVINRASLSSFRWLKIIYWVRWL